MTATVTISDVAVSGFGSGVTAFSDAHLVLQEGVQVSVNMIGLKVTHGATVDIDVPDSITRSEFNGNDLQDIYVEDGGTLNVTAAGAESELARTVVANDNASTGVLVLGGTVTLDNIGVNRNSIGVEIRAGATVRIRNSVVRDNRSYGIYVFQVGDLEAGVDASAIDLGPSATEDGPRGDNYILGNDKAGICLTDEVTGLLQARGNIFGTQAAMKDCRFGAPALSWSNNGCNSSTPLDVTRPEPRQRESLLAGIERL